MKIEIEYSETFICPVCNRKGVPLIFLWNEDEYSNNHSWQMCIHCFKEVAK